MRAFLTACLLIAFAAASPQGASIHAALAADPPPASTAPLPAGHYTLDKAHASLIFRVDHIGFSNYTGRFTRFDAELDLDPADPSKAQLTARIDPGSLEADNPPEGFLAMLRGPDWLDAGAFPEMVYRSTAIELTGPDKARVTGDLAFHGVTLPVTLEVRFNGGYAGHPFDPNARIGFSARGSLTRSAFGVGAGLPPPGSKLGVSDLVEIVIEAELTGPPLAGAQPAQ